MKDVTQWYEAFDKHDPSLLDRILDENWVDIPAAPASLRVLRVRNAFSKSSRQASPI
jgi:hypothetical protein